MIVTPVIERHNMMIYHRIFTHRELEIMKMIIEQKTAQEIATIFYKSKRTIDGNRASIQKKMGVKSIQGIVAYAIAAELFTITFKDPKFKGYPKKAQIVTIT